MNKTMDTVENRTKTLLSDECIDIDSVLIKAKGEFKRVFGRDPEPRDPVFLDVYLKSDDEIGEQFAEFLEERDIPPEIIHAYKETGIIIETEAERSNFSAKELEQWDKAIAEYFSESPGPPQEERQLIDPIA